MAPEHPDLAKPCPVAHLPGHGESLLEAMNTVDEWGWSVSEILAEKEPIRAAELAVARWCIAAAIRPDLNPPRAAQRLMYRWVDVPIRYSANVVTHDVTQHLAESGLVSSMLENGLQKPALDLDYPAELWQDGSGVRWLRIEPTSPALDWHGADMVYEADRAMAALGLERTERPRTVLRSCRTEGRLIARLGEQWQTGYEELVAVVSTMETGSGWSSPPPGGVWYRVDGPAQLVPSTSWSHLYMDRTVPSSVYLPAMQVAGGCGLLNPGFVNALEARGFTSLRRPGMRKNPDPLPLDDIPF